MRKIISNFIETEFSDNNHLDFSKTPEFRSFVNCCRNDNVNVYFQFNFYLDNTIVIGEADNLSRALGLGQTYRTYLKKVSENNKVVFALAVYQIFILLSNVDGPITGGTLKQVKSRYIEIFELYKDVYKNADIDMIMPIIFSFTKDILFRLDEYAFKWELNNGK